MLQPSTSPCVDRAALPLDAPAPPIFFVGLRGVGSPLASRLASCLGVLEQEPAAATLVATPAATRQ